MTISYPLIKNENLPPNGSHSFFYKKAPIKDGEPPDRGIIIFQVLLYFKSFDLVCVLVNSSYAIGNKCNVFACLTIDYHIAVKVISV